jgi:hypothetical protein
VRIDTIETRTGEHSLTGTPSPQPHN